MSDVTGSQSFTVTRADLVRYAGASGDFNPIHHDESFATAIGLQNLTNLDLRSLAQRAFHLQPSADFVHPLAHHDQTNT